MSAGTISAKILNKLRGKPTGDYKELARYLRSSRCLSAPEENGLEAALVNQVTELIERMQDLKEMSPLIDRLELALNVYKPDYPPHSPVTLSFFHHILYFDAAYGQGRETLGLICWELGAAMGMHPARLQALQQLCAARLGWYVHEGFSADGVCLRDLWTEQLFEVKVKSGYRGATGEMWLVRIANLGGLQVLTTPYVVKHPDLVAFREVVQRQPDVERLKHPREWAQWLELVRLGYESHTDQALFLEMEHQQEVEPGTCSLAQRWSPAVVDGGEPTEPYRPRLLLYVDEQNGRVYRSETLPERLTPQQVSDWLPSVPKCLWVDDEELLAFFREHRRDVACLLKKKLPQLERALGALQTSLAPQEHSLSGLLGEQSAQVFYEAAWKFYAAAPWTRISSEECLLYVDAGGQAWSVVVMGSAGEEFGLAIFADPKDGPAMIRGEALFPTLGFSLSPNYLVPARDLDFLEKSRLQFPGGEFPWLIFKPPALRPFSPRHCAVVLWLLVHIPAFAMVPSRRLETGEGSLSLLDEGDAEHALDMLVDLLLGLWGKRSQHAEELAVVLSDFAGEVLLPRCKDEKQFEKEFHRLAQIGANYLVVHGRKRKVAVEYFLGLGQDRLSKELASYMGEIEF